MRTWSQEARAAALVVALIALAPFVAAPRVALAGVGKIEAVIRQMFGGGVSVGGELADGQPLAYDSTSGSWTNLDRLSVASLSARDIAAESLKVADISVPGITIQGTSDPGLVAASDAVVYATASDELSRLPTPDTLPANRGAATAWDPTGEFLAVAHNTLFGSGGITVYQRTGSTFTALPPPDVLPGRGIQADWDPTGEFLAVANGGAPSIIVYKRSGTSLTKIPNPDVLPTNAQTVAWHPSGNFLAVGATHAPRLSFYQFDSQELTKIPDLDVILTHEVRGVSWSPDGNLLAIAMNNPTALALYEFDSSTLSLSSISTGITLGSSGYDVHWHPSGEFLATSSGGSGVRVFRWNGSALVIPGITASIPGGVAGVRWDPSGEFLAAMSRSNDIGFRVFRFDGESATPIPDPDVPLGGAAISELGKLQWDPSGRFLAIPTHGSPYIAIYERRGASLYVKNSDGASVRLGLVVGQDVQAHDPQLDDVAGLVPEDGAFIAGDGSHFVAVAGEEAREALGLGTIATQDADAVDITGGSIIGATIEDVALTLSDEFMDLVAQGAIDMPPNPHYIAHKNSRLYASAWSPSGAYLAIQALEALHDNSQNHIDVEIWKQEGTSSNPSMSYVDGLVYWREGSASPADIAWNSSETLIALATTSAIGNQLAVYTVTPGGTIGAEVNIDTPPAWVRQCEWDPLGEDFLAVAGLDQLVSVYQFDGTDMVLLGFNPDLGGATAARDVAWDPTGEFLAVAHSDGLAAFQRSGTAFSEISIGDQPGPLIFVEWNDAGDYLVCGGSEGFSVYSFDGSSSFARVAEVDGAYSRLAAWSGSLVAIAGPYGGLSVFRWDGTDETLKRIASPPFVSGISSLRWDGLGFLAVTPAERRRTWPALTGGEADVSFYQASGATLRAKNVSSDNLILGGAITQAAGVVTLTDSATVLFSVGLPDGERGGGLADVMIQATDGTDHQALVQTVRWAAVNKGGAITASVKLVDTSNDASAISSGTLSATYDALPGAGIVSFRVTPSGSLTETTYTASVSVRSFGSAQVVVGP